MNLTIYNFIKNNKIIHKYICKPQLGNNISPKISWNKVNDTKSYALVFEDPNAVGHTFIHWYIPYISPDILEIDQLDMNDIGNFNLLNFNSINLNKIKIFQGKNGSKKIGYHGPCAPENSGEHNYIFTIFALDDILHIDNNIISIYDSNNFRDILSKNNINILNSDTKSFKYRYMNFYSDDN